MWRGKKTYCVSLWMWRREMPPYRVQLRYPLEGKGHTNQGSFINSFFFPNFHVRKLFPESWTHLLEGKCLWGKQLLLRSNYAWSLASYALVAISVYDNGQKVYFTPKTHAISSHVIKGSLSQARYRSWGPNAFLFHITPTPYPQGWPAVADPELMMPAMKCGIWK